MHRHIRHAGLVLASAALVATATFSSGAAAAEKNAPVRCLSITQLGNSRILDDQNILFRTSPSHYYINHLPRKCNGLKSAGKFRFKTSLSQLCNVDTITVLIGTGDTMMDGATCGLGMFTPATKEEVKAWDKKKK